MSRLPRKSNGLRIYYRLGIAADAGPLEAEASSYYGLAIGANVASWGQSWAAGLLSRTGKPFFIDPMTHVFAQDPSMILKEDDVRQSYVELIKGYGRILPTVAGKRPLRPGDFWKASRLMAAGQDFVDAVLSFELTALSRGESIQRRISDYLQMIGEGSEIPELAPEFLIPPYFYASSLDDDWYAVSLAMARHAASRRGVNEIVPVICISDRTLVDEPAVGRIVADYGRFPSVIIWVSDFDETRATVSQLAGYGRLVEQLTKRGIAPLALYGGFFALTLAVVGLIGVSSGVCYGESKGVARQATGGGVPLRYYVPWAHAKVVKANAITFYTANPVDYCKCSVCRAILREANGQADASKVVEAFEQMDRARAGRHFLRIRAQEARLCEKATKASCQRVLESERLAGEGKRATAFGIPIAPIGRWKEALERL